MNRTMRISCSARPSSTDRGTLNFEALFTDAEAEAEAMQNGVVPLRMDEKWFIFPENGWLYFHRRWTGTLIYWLRLEMAPGRMRVVESWVSRDSKQYQATDPEYRRQLPSFLIDALLMNKQVTLPMPPDAPDVPPEVVQHSIAGRAYPKQQYSDSKRKKTMPEIAA